MEILFVLKSRDPVISCCESAPLKVNSRKRYIEVVWLSFRLPACSFQDYRDNPYQYYLRCTSRQNKNNQNL